MKTLKGAVTITRRHGKTDVMAIAIRDDMSFCQFVELEMSLEDFMKALTGLGDQPCKFEFRPDKVGLKLEHKTEIVQFECKVWANRELEAKLAVAPFNKDGWEGRWDDLLNHHNRGGGEKPTYRVNFLRWVEP